MKYATKNGKVCAFSEDPDEVIEAVERAEKLKTMVKSAMEYAVHDFAARIYNHFVIMPKQGNDFEPAAIKQSETYVDQIVRATLEDAKKYTSKEGSHYGL